jgi:glycosyltransferase involved in cell wall biosynthesis
MTSLSVLVPAYNEQHLVAASLARLDILESSPLLEQIQVIVVDDCSTDGTSEALRAFATTRGLAWREDAAPVNGTSLLATGRAGKTDWVFLRHARNGGKGCAIRTALAHARCAITVIHDADLEYNPRDLDRIVRVFVEERADAVFGSRFAGARCAGRCCFATSLAIG